MTQNAQDQQKTGCAPVGEGQVSDLLERLRKVEPDKPGDRTRWYRNPDGPEAADRIATQRIVIESYADSCKAACEEIARLKERLAAAEAALARHKDGGADGNDEET